MHTVAVWLRWLAFLAFLAGCVAALPPPGARIARVPWLAIGLTLWVAAEIVGAGDFAVDDG